MSEERLKEYELLKAFPQWQLLQAELQGALEEVENEIFAERQREIKYSYDDILKRERKILKWFVTLPDTLIDDIKNSVIEERDE